MARTVKITSGSLFIKNPIILQANAESLDQVTLHRMVVKVRAVIWKEDPYFKDFLFSAPVENAETVYFDISSALRACAEKFEVERETTNYPYLKYQISVWDEYLKEGMLKTTPVTEMSPEQTALMGGFTDIERMVSQENFKAVQYFSRKPQTGEVIAQNETLVQPVPFPTPQKRMTAYGQKTVALNFDGKLGLQEIRYSDLYHPETDYDHSPITEDYVVRSVFVIPPTADRYHFYFLNGLGVVETIAAQSYPDISQKMKTETHIMAVPETFNHFSRTKVHKTSSVRAMKMSSGPLTEEWLEWWISEFLPSEKVWIRLDDLYLPCSIVPEENISIKKGTKSDAMQVLFTVNVDVNGGIHCIL